MNRFEKISGLKGEARVRYLDGELTRATHTDVACGGDIFDLLMAEGQQQTLAEASQTLQRLPEWAELTQEEQLQTLARLDDLAITTTPDLHGIKRLLNQEYVIQATASDLKRSIERYARERRVTIAESGPSARRTVTLPPRLTSVVELEALLRSLEALRVQLDEAIVIEFALERPFEY